MASKPQQRLDILLHELGLAESREKAKAILMSGQVYVNGQRQDKAGTKVAADANIEIRGRGLPYASRGGLKIAKALEDFAVDVHGLVAADIGASTGGFTHCLLQGGARKVYAIDVGYGQLVEKLRTDERVVVMDRTNARYLEAEQFAELPDLVSIDVSFISLKLIWPAACRILSPQGLIISLIKPQFEAGPHKVGHGGVVRDPAVHEEVLNELLELSNELELELMGLTYSPIRGPAGNIEFLAGFRRKGRESDSVKVCVHDLVQQAWQNTVSSAH